MTVERRRVVLLGFGVLIVLTSLLGLIALVDRLDDAEVISARVTDDDLQLELVLDTCNADVSVDVEEHHDRVVLQATHHDWYRYLTGSDDCQDIVRVDLDAPLGSRVVVVAD